VIGDVLPAGIAWAETFAERLDGGLFPDEAAVVAKAVGKRRREFAAVRACARRALADIGVEPVPILPGDAGQPQWPSGIVGSMTHCAGYRAAAVASTATVAAVGIDAEPHDPLPDGVLGAVSRPGERAHLADLRRAAPGVAWDRLLFCAKEATYKAWFPLTGTRLGFDQAEVTFDVAGRTFTSRLLVPGPRVACTRVDTFTGRWAASESHVAAAVTLR
jgi:4'-phosphopantetheinyl transferase EntD